MTPPLGLRVRPTGRGLIVLAGAAGLWLLGDATGTAAPRQIAAALLVGLLLGLLSLGVISVGLRPHRRVLDEAVLVGSTVRIRLRTERSAWITAIPLGRGMVREHLPPALGGAGDLPLAPQMDHLLRVGARGLHELGPCSAVVRDVLGLFHVRRTVADGAHVIGLPPIEEAPIGAERSAGIVQDGARDPVRIHVTGETGPIARPYASGDDIRRIHWRASARTGRLMTRQDEPATGRSAVVVIDTLHRAVLTRELEDRLVCLAASALESLARNGWEARVVDASGDEITRAPRRRNPGSPLSGESEAVARRAALLALAQVGFEDRDDVGLRHDHTTADTALAIAVGADDGAPFAGLELDRFAGRSARRIAFALRPAAPASADRSAPASADRSATAPAAPAAPGSTPVNGSAPAPQRSAMGAWDLVRGTADHSFAELLTALEEER